ncbi:hypothetical protein BV25DRAFT_1843153 [Artomyces pyxidatus]|uniref:Uncharacterized protein n=1 Tax=Artomyces pyxidatus TaxID=48021 RepID=A0ACB8SH02_9AGAM|nr:hypothetical protein BV25DRAFT_1843153 [Artomyces pyxidatus]
MPATVFHQQPPEVGGKEELRKQMFRSSSPFSLLPVETVRHIFSFQSLRAELDNTVEDQQLSTCTVFNIAQVCRRWRQIALDFPRLWNRILLYNLRVTTELLVRSKDAPIVVYADFHAVSDLRPQPECLTLALQDPRRLQELIVNGTDVLPGFLQAIQSAPAPQLAVLRLDNFMRWSHLDIPLFEANTPLLHSLSLSGCSMDWAWLKTLSNMTSLQLSNFHDIYRPSLDAILDLLSRSPNLTNLSLFSVGPMITAVPEYIVDLPHLEKLNFVVADAAEYASLLTHIRVPVNARMCMSLPVDNAWEIEDLVKAPLTQHFVRNGAAQSERTQWRSLYISDEVEAAWLEHVTFFAGPEEMTGPPDGEWGDSAFTLCLSATGEQNPDVPAFLDWMLAQPPFTTVDTLVLESTFLARTPDDLRFLFNPALHITTLVLVGPTFVALCKMFQERTQDSWLHWDVMRLLQRIPHLARVVLRHCAVNSAFRSDAARLGSRYEECERLRLAGSNNPPTFAVEIAECDVDEAHVYEVWHAAGSVGAWDAGWDKQTSGTNVPLPHPVHAVFDEPNLEVVELDGEELEEWA